MQRVHNCIHGLLCILERLSLPVITAESCTSGALASALSSRPKSPTMLLGGIVAYSNSIKERMLSVNPSILDEKEGPGEVSKECALAMARGAIQHGGMLDIRGQGIGISTTGFLNGGPPGREGEVWIGCYWRFKDKIGSRAEQFWVKCEEDNIEKQSHDEVADKRDQEKHWVVDKALNVILEVVADLDKSDSRRR
ncbi:CinA-domain-containing protein [Neolentinus lepideus HHB14362 ss-1]|uniref:CinA-domain-containing protein n=1 Tax=Neolentinus lepideus HHB14362 ss-1 TaxID=1314782 RepID=A0A165RG24_9AGAM|nr:CinA-domain-containing protein [Neolentinus lepideus HHB14362 ss-1]